MGILGGNRYKWGRGSLLLLVVQKYGHLNSGEKDSHLTLKEIYMFPLMNNLHLRHVADPLAGHPAPLGSWFPS